jgi:raffinose/stachyose/melibiose transport system permease protein
MTNSHIWRRRIFPILLLLPSFLMFSVFILFPVINGFLYSLKKWDGFSTPEWIGFGNYARALSDHFVWVALMHNGYYAFFTVIGKMIIGLGLALLLNQKLKGLTAYRTVIFIPVVLSFVTVGILWSWIYNPIIGMLNNFLSIFGVENIAWLGDPKYAMASVIMVDIWKWFGYHMILFLAGLQNISPEIYEAAKIDGATRRQSFFSITFPLMIPVLIINTTLATMGAFNVFDIIYVMTSGGPYHATEVIMTYTYTQAFKFHSFGYGAAISYFLLLIIMVITGIQLRIMRKYNQ